MIVGNVDSMLSTAIRTVRPMPGNYPTVCPYLFYNDGPAALTFLTEAFGFRVRMAPEPDAFGHAEVEIGDGGVVMLGAPPSEATSGSWGGVHVYVDDVDAHCEAARRAGAKIVKEPQDQSYGDRLYETVDTEGHTWWFAQPIRR